jgi:hypothetical protein
MRSGVQIRQMQDERGDVVYRVTVGVGAAM